MSDLMLCLFMLLTNVFVIFLGIRNQVRAEELDIVLSDAARAVRQLHQLQQAYEELLASEANHIPFYLN